MDKSTVLCFFAGVKLENRGPGGNRLQRLSVAHEFGVKSLLPSQEWPCGRRAGLGWSGSLEVSRPSEGMKQVSAAGGALLWAIGTLCSAR